MSKKLYPILALLLTIAMLIVSCRAETPTPTEPPPEPAEPTEPPPPPPPEEVGGELEVFSWWTAGGEAEGLAAAFPLCRIL